jgi:hypothetical protein
MTYDSEFGSHISLYRDRIKQVIDDSLNEHPNSMILRVDLHDPIDTEIWITHSFNLGLTLVLYLALPVR